MVPRRVVSCLPLVFALCGCPDEEESPTPEGLRCPAAAVLAGEALANAGVEHDDVEALDGAVWRAAESPHRLTNSLTLEGTLTIEPCAVIEACATCRIQIGSGEAPGALVALGTAKDPIVLRGEAGAEQTWSGLLYLHTSPAGRLSFVTIDGGDTGCGTTCDDAGVISVSGSSAATTNVDGVFTNAPVLAIDHSTVRGGLRNGIFLESGGSFAAGSTDNVITGNALAPIRMELDGVRTTLADGTFTGNGEDVIRLYTPGISQLHHATTLPRRGVPYVWEDLAAASVYDLLLIEAGVQLRMVPTAVEGDTGAELTIKPGGALMAHGTAEAPIELGDDTAAAPAWNGLRFEEGAAPSMLQHVRLTGAGRQAGPTGVACVADDAIAYGAAVLLDAPGLVTITDSTFSRLGPTTYAVYRSYFGDGAPEFTDGGNVFEAPLACSETDQMPGTPTTCDGAMQCCDHAYGCASDR